MKDGLFSDVHPAKAGDFDAEAIILEWARNGKLHAAGWQAIQDSHRRGLSVPIVDGDTIYLLHPDGRKEPVKKLPPHPAHNFPSGQATIS